MCRGLTVSVDSVGCRCVVAWWCSKTYVCPSARVVLAGAPLGVCLGTPEDSACWPPFSPLSCSHSRFLSHEEDSQLRGGARPGQDKREDAAPQRRAAARRYRHQHQLPQQERHWRIDAEPSHTPQTLTPKKRKKNRLPRWENASICFTGGQILFIKTKTIIK